MKHKAVIFSLLLIVTIIILVPAISQAQSTETGSVQMLVQQQIEEAKKKNNAQAVIVEKPIPVKKETKEAVENNSGSSGIGSEYFFKAGIMLFASAIVFFWLKTRRSKKYLIDKNNRFKKNIKLIREEKFIKEIDPKLKEIRTRLTLTSVVLNEDKKVTAAARKSQIGKEEILLASRIRAHKIEYGGQRSFA